ncbi:MAG: hypothetical protein QOF74_7698 [Caballeronia mineralivorans]|nr:hypothetical protein [Caballeronia mineralivorans]
MLTQVRVFLIQIGINGIKKNLSKAARVSLLSRLSRTPAYRDLSFGSGRLQLTVEQIEARGHDLAGLIFAAAQPVIPVHQWRGRDTMHHHRRRDNGQCEWYQLGELGSVAMFERIRQVVK